MSFTLFTPCIQLRPFVRSFAISINTGAGYYKVLPDTGIVMGFQYSGHLFYTDGDIQVPLSQAGITGLDDRFKIFGNAAYTGTVLVIFTETGASAFFDLAMHELFGHSVSLGDLVLQSQMDRITELIQAATTDAGRINAVEQFLIARNNNKPDELVAMAVGIIKQHAGIIKIAALANILHISLGQLEKRFRKVVGATPKKFAGIVRLKSIVSKGGKQSTLTRSGLEAGYYDQAHFIKDFRTFTGQTPQQFFSENKKNDDFLQS